MKQTFVSAIIIASLIAIAPAGFAGINKDKNKGETSSASSTSSIQVNYLGEEDDYLILQVMMLKGDKKTAVMRIRDGKGEELYSERFTGTSYARYIKVSPDELKNIEVELNTSNGNLRKSYNLSTSKVTNFQITEVVLK